MTGLAVRIGLYLFFKQTPLLQSAMHAQWIP